MNYGSHPLLGPLPYTLHSPRTSSISHTQNPLQMLTVGWLLCLSAKRHPLYGQITAYLSFFRASYSGAQTREPTLAIGSLMPRACCRPIGSYGAKSWDHGRCCHGNRGQSHWGIGRWQLMLVVVCFDCVLGCGGSWLAVLG